MLKVRGTIVGYCQGDTHWFKIGAKRCECGEQEEGPDWPTKPPPKLRVVK